VFTARYELSPYINQTRLVFKGLVKAAEAGRDSSVSVVTC
jgi:hypothetical protein